MDKEHDASLYSDSYSQESQKLLKLKRQHHQSNNNRHKSQDMTDNSTYLAEPRGILKKVKNGLRMDDRANRSNPNSVLNIIDMDQSQYDDQLTSSDRRDDLDVGEEWQK